MSEAEKTELETLQERCRLMGISFHPNSKEESLRAKISAVLNDETTAEAASAELTGDPVDNGKPANSSMPDLVAPKTKAFVPETKEQKAYRLKLQGTKLIRVYVHCNNPMKKEWQGEQFTVSNRNLGTINRFVPFEQEWHVEAAILDMMRDRTYLGFTTRKAGPMKLEIKEPKFVKEFNIEVLEPLTQKEINDLAVKQAMQAGDTEAAVE